MSCEFCNKFDFTSVAVKDNNICSAGGSSRFTDDHYKSKPEYQLFNHCPICGAKLCYYVEATLTKEGSTTVVVAVDDTGRRIPFAVEDSDVVLTKEVYDIISDLRADTGCTFRLAKSAYDQVGKYGYGSMIAYVNTHHHIKANRDAAKLFWELQGAE